MDIKLEYMIEAYDIKFDEMRHLCEAPAFVGASLKFVANKAINTIIMAASVIFAIKWVGETASNKVVDEMKRGRENLKDNAKDTSTKIKRLVDDVSETAKTLQSDKGQRWLISKLKIITNAMLAYVRRAGRFAISTSGWDNLSVEKRETIHKLWTMNIRALTLATKSSVAVGTIMAVIYLSYKLLSDLKQKNAESVKNDLKNKSVQSVSLAKRAIRKRNIGR